MWAERVAHRGGYNIQEDDTFFQIYYLKSEANDIYDIIALLVQEKAGVSISKPPVIFDENKYEKSYGKDGSTVEELLDHMEKKVSLIQKRDNLEMEIV